MKMFACRQPRIFPLSIFRAEMSEISISAPRMPIVYAQVLSEGRLPLPHSSTLELYSPIRLSAAMFEECSSVHIIHPNSAKHISAELDMQLSSVPIAIYTGFPYTEL